SRPRHRGSPGPKAAARPPRAPRRGEDPSQESCASNTPFPGDPGGARGEMACRGTASHLSRPASTNGEAGRTLWPAESTCQPGQVPDRETQKQPSGASAGGESVEEIDLGPAPNRERDPGVQALGHDVQNVSLSGRRAAAGLLDDERQRLALVEDAELRLGLSALDVRRVHVDP